MGDQECVSVIIPVYNTEKYLERSIQSVVGQSYDNLDIILVDDGSTDDSTAICRSWECKDNRITYIRQNNAGLGAARNIGMRAAKSDYVTFLDSDDWFEPDFINKIINSMLDTNSDVGLCDIYYVDSATMSRQAVKLRFNKPLFSSREDNSVLNKSRLFAWGKIYKKELLSNCSFGFPDIAYEDSCVPVLIACANRISYVAEPLIDYFRNRPGSLSNDYDKIKDIGKGLQLLYDKLNEMAIYKGYLLEYKKIVLGQLRFACRKWGGLKNETVTYELQNLEKFTGDMFPELMGLIQRKYFAFGSQTLMCALDKALPYAEQITNDISKADRIVVFRSDVCLVPQNEAKLIMIAPTEYASEDRETIVFNIAELIMENLR